MHLISLGQRILKWYAAIGGMEVEHPDLWALEGLKRSLESTTERRGGMVSGIHRIDSAA
jgi:hypothetical protein